MVVSLASRGTSILIFRVAGPVFILPTVFKGSLFVHARAAIVDRERHTDWSEMGSQCSFPWYFSDG